MNTVNVGKNFSVVIPEQFRALLKLEPGTPLVVSVSAGELRLRPRAAEVRKNIGILSKSQNRNQTKAGV